MKDIQSSTQSDTQDNQPAFFVVSPMKLGVMSFFTLGFYWVYCFYQNWKLYKLKTGDKVIPLLRAGFAVFFIYAFLKRVEGAIRDSGKAYSWSIVGLTLGYYAILVVGLIASIVLTEHLFATYVVGQVLQLAWLLVLLPMQRGANFCIGDEAGVTNSEFSWANWLWLLSGAAFKLFQLWAVFMVATIY